MKRILYVFMMSAIMVGSFTCCEKPDQISIGVQAPVQENLVGMFKSLGLVFVSSTNKSVNLVDGDICEIKFTDHEKGGKYDWKYNKELSDRNKIVYVGLIEDFNTGAVGNLRMTISEITNGLSVYREFMINDEYVSRGTWEYIMNPDKTVAEFFVLSDGTKRKDFTWHPSTQTSLVKVDAYNAEEYVVDNIEITQE